MPNRMISILGRLRQDVAAAISAETIEAACKEVGYRWRRRKLGPVETIYLFLVQVLLEDTSCRHVVRIGGREFTDTAYCKARSRLPLAVFLELVRRVAAAVRGASEDSRWHGHRVWVVDGSSVSMPDAPELQGHFGQPGGQRPGCGFPVAKLLMLFHVGTGMLLRVTAAPLRSHDMSGAGAISGGLEPGDVLLGDRGFRSYAHMAMLLGRGISAVFRMHQQVNVDFAPGRPTARRKGPYPRPQGLPSSRWVLAHGPQDQVVAWPKPKGRPGWMTEEEYAALPEEILVRELRYEVATPGYRVRRVTLATTLLDAAAYPAVELAELYYRRWRVEHNLRHMKITMKMDVLKCTTVEGVLKELAMYAIAYNLVRSAMLESARLQRVDPDRISLIDGLRWLTAPAGECESPVLVVNPSRRGRYEPRVKKRRPKQYLRMTKPRREYHKDLLQQWVAA
ncbi:Transposase DDE domain protein [Aquisphaera giovannonii]|uniref:Transposase DDE domain protein n=1 Tax=Aquisphaera giovannonii TaxID=406548 RepID=A0A5B9W2X6_9BACT|nr:IS4 family transposase [Aquisphaera giovannonii]QEH34597.1 Transposase DDE domain protein [Aquisphaera giovannonii]